MSVLHQPTLKESVEHGESVNMHSLERYLSAAGGAILTVSGMRRGFRGGAVRMLVGAEMLRRGLTGHCYTYQAFGVRTASRNGDTSVPYELGVHVRTSITIRRPRAEVYAFWRNFENLPRVMRHLLSVENRGGGVTRWIVEGPMGRRVQWDAELVADVEGERISWRSLPGSQVDSAGSVLFSDAPRGRGTEVHIEMQYNPPAGYVGAFGAKLFGRDARSAIEADCWRLKEYLEAGEVPTTEGQPRGPSERESRRRRDVPPIPLTREPFEVQI